MILLRDSIRKAKENFNSLEEIQLFIKIFLFLSMIPISIRVLSIPSLMTLITPKKVKTYKKLNNEDLKERVVKYTDYLLSRNFWIYKPKCLKRSLILYHFLRRAGINVHICFGVRFSNGNSVGSTIGKFEGHAWLVYNGQIYLEKYNEMTKSYKMTYCYPIKNEESMNQVFYKS